MARVLINLPESAKRGEVIEIKTLIQHPMETGYRLDSNGARIPRDIINRFRCTYNGEDVFRAELFPAIAANPVHRVFDDRDGDRRIGLHLDRRRRSDANREPANYHRMRSLSGV